MAARLLMWRQLPGSRAFLLRRAGRFLKENWRLTVTMLYDMLYKTEHMFAKGDENMGWTFTEIVNAFQGYIKGSKYIDVCHTKFGYVILHYDPAAGDFAYIPEVIETPEELLQCLKEEIVMDVLQDTEHDLEDATEAELTEIEAMTEKYMTILEGMKPAV